MIVAVNAAQRARAARLIVRLDHRRFDVLLQKRDGRRHSRCARARHNRVRFQRGKAALCPVDTHEPQALRQSARRAQRKRAHAVPGEQQLVRLGVDFLHLAQIGDKRLGLAAQRLNIARGNVQTARPCKALHARRHVLRRGTDRHGHFRRGGAHFDVLQPRPLPQRVKHRHSLFARSQLLPRPLDWRHGCRNAQAELDCRHARDWTRMKNDAIARQIERCGHLQRRFIQRGHIAALECERGSHLAAHFRAARNGLRRRVDHAVSRSIVNAEFAGQHRADRMAVLHRHAGGRIHQQRLHALVQQALHEVLLHRPNGRGKLKAAFAVPHPAVICRRQLAGRIRAPLGQHGGMPRPRRLGQHGGMPRPRRRQRQRPAGQPAAQYRNPRHVLSPFQRHFFIQSAL